MLRITRIVMTIILTRLTAHSSDEQKLQAQPLTGAILGRVSATVNESENEWGAPLTKWHYEQFGHGVPFTLLLCSECSIPRL